MRVGSDTPTRFWKKWHGLSTAGTTGWSGARIAESGIGSHAMLHATDPVPTLLYFAGAEHPSKNQGSKLFGDECGDLIAAAGQLIL